MRDHPDYPDLFDHSSERRIPTPGLPIALAFQGAIWLGLLIYDILATDLWRYPPDEFGIVRRILPIIGLLPAAIRLLRPSHPEIEQAAYRRFVQLTIAGLIVVGLFALFNVVPFEYTPNATPAGVWGLAMGRIVALIALIGLPALAENLVRLYSYRTRGDTPRITTIFSVGLMGTVLLGQLLSPVQGSAGRDLSDVVYGIGAGVGVLSFILAVNAGWLINLKKREKWRLLGLSALGIPLAIGLLVLQQSSDVGLVLIGIAPGLSALAFTLGISILFLYLVIFVSALFALPTADAIDRRNAEVSSLANFARLLTQSLDAEHLVDTAITIACDATGANAAWIELREGESREIFLGSSPRIKNRIARQMMAVPVAFNLPIAQAVLQRRRVEVADRVNGILGTRSGNGAPVELRSMAAAPLQLGDNLLGTLYVAKERAGGFDREDIILLTALTDQIALALEQARLIRQSLERERFEQEMLIAQDLQQRLLPKVMPQSPQYEIYAESLPASIVGGDYYDVVTFSDGSLGVLVADVSGKGASAALYMGMIKGIIQALSGRCASPRELLQQANVALYGSIDQRWFATMTCAQIVEEERMLRIARAGHCPTLFVRDGTGGYTRPKGLGLSIARPYLFDRNLEIEEIRFSPGDYAIFFSDGLPEARSAGGEEFGYEPLLETVVEAAARQATPHQMRDAIFQKITLFAEGEPPADDSTLVILRWR